MPQKTETRGLKAMKMAHLTVLFAFIHQVTPRQIGSVYSHAFSTSGGSSQLMNSDGAGPNLPYPTYPPTMYSHTNTGLQPSTLSSGHASSWSSATASAHSGGEHTGALAETSSVSGGGRGGAGWVGSDSSYQMHAVSSSSNGSPGGIGLRSGMVSSEVNSANSRGGQGVSSQQMFSSHLPHNTPTFHTFHQHRQAPSSVSRVSSSSAGSATVHGEVNRPSNARFMTSTRGGISPIQQSYQAHQSYISRGRSDDPVHPASYGQRNQHSHRVPGTSRDSHLAEQRQYFPASGSSSVQYQSLAIQGRRGSAGSGFYRAAAPSSSHFAQHSGGGRSGERSTVAHSGGEVKRSSDSVVHPGLRATVVDSGSVSIPPVSAPDVTASRSQGKTADSGANRVDSTSGQPMQKSGLRYVVHSRTRLKDHGGGLMTAIIPGCGTVRLRCQTERTGSSSVTKCQTTSLKPCCSTSSCT